MRLNQKRGQEPIVRSTLRAIWLLVPDPFFAKVFGRRIGFLDVVPAGKATRLPVVLSRNEIGQLLPLFQDLKQLMFLVMYGAGLRHLECRRLRVKDVCFDEGHIVVRNAKGDQDRITVLPDKCRERLKEPIERVRCMHAEDLERNQGRVWLPHALERKYPNASAEPAWQWVFPARQYSVDPVSGERRRHHVCEDFFAKEFARQLKRSKIAKHMSHQFVTIRKETMRTQTIHVQTVFQLTDRTFGNVAAMNIEAAMNTTGITAHIDHDMANVAAALLCGPPPRRISRTLYRE